MQLTSLKSVASVLLATALSTLFIAGCTSPTTQPVAPLQIVQASNVLDATSHGIVADGHTLNTTAIQAAIDSLSSAGGGVLAFSPGKYLTGTIQLKDNVTLRLADQAVLLGSINPEDYRNLDPFMAGDYKARFGYALITAIRAHHVGIEGTGTIDGQGKALHDAQKKFDVRPFLIRWEQCTDVKLSEIRLTNPAAWTMQIFKCSQVAVDHITIVSSLAHLLNNDGIDIDSSHDVTVADCDIDSGDDAICIKATSPQASHDLSITRCRLKTRCNGIKLGTESLGDFYNIRASHCQMRDIGMAGIAIYDVDGAQVHDVTLTDLDMDRVTVPISIRLGSRLKTFRPGDQPRPVGTIREVHIENIRATGAKQIGLLINGIPDHPVQSLHLKNVEIELLGDGKAKDAEVKLGEKESTYPEMNMFGKTMPAYAGYIRHATGLTFENVTFNLQRPDARPACVLIDTDGITSADFVVK